MRATGCVRGHNCKDMRARTCHLRACVRGIAVRGLCWHASARHCFKPTCCHRMRQRSSCLDVWLSSSKSVVQNHQAREQNIIKRRCCKNKPICLFGSEKTLDRIFKFFVGLFLVTFLQTCLTYWAVKERGAVPPAPPAIGGVHFFFFLRGLLLQHQIWSCSSFSCFMGA